VSVSWSLGFVVSGLVRWHCDHGTIPDPGVVCDRGGNPDRGGGGNRRGARDRGNARAARVAVLVQIKLAIISIFLY
jgi:hypothetical protein